MSHPSANLNPEQLRCATNFDGPYLLIAGAGTGKTKTITSRLARMLQTGIPPQNIVALTFTNKAAREMRERLTGMVGTGKGTKVNLGTFHSFCLKILREFSSCVDLSRRFSILSPTDQIDIVRKAIAERGMDKAFSVEHGLKIIGEFKNQICFSVSDCSLRATNFSQLTQIYIQENPEQVWNFFVDYERYLKLNDAIDFDDCMYKLAYVLTMFPEVKKKLCDRFLYFVVDEYQDTNLLQLEILKHLCSEHKNICVVGDDDQSIYSWRGAYSGIFLEFEKIFSGTRIIKLEQNYRCSTIILDAANAVIKNNVARKDKQLWSESKITEKISCTQFETEEHQASEIGHKIMSLLGRGESESEIAVLYRTNAQANAVELALKELGIRYKVFGGQSLFERKEIKDTLAYLELVSNPDSKIAFWRIINTPNRGIGLKTLEKIADYCKKNHVTPMAAVHQLSDHDLTASTAERARAFVAKIKELSQLPVLTPADVSTLTDRIIKEFRLLEHLNQHHHDEESLERKMMNVSSLPGWLEKNFERSLKYNPDHTGEDFLDRLFLKDFETGGEKDSKNHVSLMSIHTAKGLEFGHVFIIGINENILPHKNSLDPAQNTLDEERRLFYVALTRAKKKLYLSHVDFQTVRGEKFRLKSSRFLNEIPEVLLESSVVKESISDDQKKRRTLSKIRAIREQRLG